MAYNLELNTAIKEIKKQKAKTVLIQLPDGLKPRAKEIADELEKQTKAKIVIWLGTCYGACDYPNLKNIDLLIQWGHNEFK
ncbi:diphthamide synthesis protein [Candidatus Woesearchaeota archaeon]|nr:diphthamide synthesis protein [Candidatus Woesearchaeota archaeon]